MPFDGMGFRPTVIRVPTSTEFWSATPLERCAMLSTVLRYAIPEDHIWDFRHADAKFWTDDYNNHCGSAGCAIGIARNLWGQVGDEHFGPPAIFGYAGLGCHEQVYPNVLFWKTTPEMVADALDRYILTGDPRP